MMKQACYLIVVLAIALSLQPLRAAEMAPQLLATSDGSFDRPHDLVLSPDKQLLFVADIGNDAVKVLDPSSLKTVGVIGASELDSPHDVAFDRDGRLLVADSGNDRIAIYTVDGATGRYVGELRGGLSSPEGVAPASDGSVYATSAGGNEVVVFRGGEVAMRAGRHGGGDGEYIRPHDIDIDAAGRIHVADPGNNRIQILGPNLKTIDSLTGPGYAFNEPKYLAFDAQGGLLVADEYNNQVKLFDKARRLTAAIGGGQLNQPEGVTVWRDRIWISDTYNNRILSFRR